MKTTDIIRVLKNEGFEFKSQRGSHIKFTHPDGRSYAVVNNKEYSPERVKGIAKMTQINIEKFFPDQKTKLNGVKNGFSETAENGGTFENPDKKFSEPWPKLRSGNPLLTLEIGAIAYWILGNKTIRDEIEERFKLIEKIQNNGSTDKKELEKKVEDLELFLTDQLLFGCRNHQPRAGWTQENFEINDDKIFGRIFAEPQEKEEDKEKYENKLKQLHYKLASFLSEHPKMGETADTLCGYIRDFDEGGNKKILLSLAVLLANHKQGYAAFEKNDLSQISQQLQRIFSGHSRESLFQEVDNLLANLDEGLTSSQVLAIGDVLKFFKQNPSFKKKLIKRLFPKITNNLTDEEPPPSPSLPANGSSQKNASKEETPAEVIQKIDHLLKAALQRPHVDTAEELLWYTFFNYNKSWTDFLTAMRKAVNERNFSEEALEQLEHIRELGEKFTQVGKHGKSMSISDRIQKTLKKQPQGAQSKISVMPHLDVKAQEFWIGVINTSELPTDDAYMVGAFSMGENPRHQILFLSDKNPEEFKFFKQSFLILAEAATAYLRNQPLDPNAEKTKKMIGDALLKKMKHILSGASKEIYTDDPNRIPTVEAKNLLKFDAICEILEKKNGILEMLILAHNVLLHADSVKRKIDLKYNRIVEEAVKAAVFISSEEAKQLNVKNIPNLEGWNETLQQLKPAPSPDRPRNNMFAEAIQELFRSEQYEYKKETKTDNVSQRIARIQENVDTISAARLGIPQSPSSQTTPTSQPKDDSLKAKHIKLMKLLAAAQKTAYDQIGGNRKSLIPPPGETYSI